MNTGYSAGEEWSFSAVHKNLFKCEYTKDVCWYIPNTTMPKNTIHFTSSVDQKWCLTVILKQLRAAVQFDALLDWYQYLDFSTYMKAYHKGVQIDTVSEDM